MLACLNIVYAQSVKHDEQILMGTKNNSVKNACPEHIAQSEQLVLSISDDWNSNKSKLILFERIGPGGGWSMQGSEQEAYIGKNGLGWGVGLHEPDESKPHQKMEGDGRAPAGVFRLLEAFGTTPPENLNLKTAYLHVDENSRCIDDKAHSLYNSYVDDLTKLPQESVNWSSEEKMAIPSYKIGIIVDHNHFKSPKTEAEDLKPIPGRGSCIFMHNLNPTRKLNEAGEYSGTAGCTAFEEGPMKNFVSKIDETLKPIMVQLTREDYNRYKKSWCLPEI